MKNINKMSDKEMSIYRIMLAFRREQEWMKRHLSNEDVDEGTRTASFAITEVIESFGFKPSEIPELIQKYLSIFEVAKND